MLCTTALFYYETTIITPRQAFMHTIFISWICYALCDNKTKGKSLDNVIWPQTIKDKQTTDLLAKNDARICYFLICHPVVGCGYLALKVQHFCFIAIIWRKYFDTFTLIMYIRIGFVESLENWQARDNKHSAFNRCS